MYLFINIDYDSIMKKILKKIFYSCKNTIGSLELLHFFLLFVDVTDTISVINKIFISQVYFSLFQ